MPRVIISAVTLTGPLVRTAIRQGQDVMGNIVMGTGAPNVS